MMMSLRDTMRRKIDEHQRRVALSWAEAALGAAAEAAPSPEKTTTSTGRALESLAVQPVDPPTWDPGKRSVHRPTTAEDAGPMLADWKPGQDVVLGYGVDYDIYFEWIYGSIRAGHDAGLAALRAA